MNPTKQDFRNIAINYLQKIWPEYTYSTIEHMLEEDVQANTLAEYKRLAEYYVDAAHPDIKNINCEEQVLKDIREVKLAELKEELAEGNRIAHEQVTEEELTL